MSKRETKTVVLPAFLASLLINGDSSGIEASDAKWVKLAFEKIGNWNVVDVSDEPYFDNINMLGFWFHGEVAEYTLLK